MDNNQVALREALAAILSEAADLNIDVRDLCVRAKNGLFDSAKRYRIAGADVVIPAIREIDAALEIALDKT